MGAVSDSLQNQSAAELERLFRADESQRKQCYESLAREDRFLQWIGKDTAELVFKGALVGGIASVPLQGFRHAFASSTEAMLVCGLCCVAAFWASRALSLQNIYDQKSILAACDERIDAIHAELARRESERTETGRRALAWWGSSSRASDDSGATSREKNEAELERLRVAHGLKSPVATAPTGAVHSVQEEPA